MAAPFLKLPRFVAGRPIVDPTTGNPSSDFVTSLNNTLNNLSVAINQLKTMQDDIVASLEAAGIALTTAQDIDAALALSNSYVDPQQVLSAETDPGDATKSKITIVDHDRVYGGMTPVTKAVTGGSISALDPTTLYLVYYDDPTRAGGSVTYHATVDPTAAVQKGIRHLVGTVITPTAGSPDTVGGGGTTGPGVPPRYDNYPLP